MDAEIEQHFGSQFLAIAETILRRAGHPMSVRQIIEVAQEQAVIPTRFTGKTPAQTLKSKLSVHIRRLGAKSVFLRTAPGRFFLRGLLAQGAEEYFAIRTAPPPPVETILAVNAALLRSSGIAFQGVRKISGSALVKLLNGKCQYVDRRLAEERDDLKQIVTFVIVKRGERILTFRRGTYSRAARYLHGTRCTGFGGHVALQDLTLFDRDLGVMRNAVRELTEELELPTADLARLRRLDGIKVAGILNDDASTVGRRHLAVLLTYDVSASEEWDYPTRGERAVTQLTWLRSDAGALRLNDFDYWSQLSLRSLFPRLARVSPIVDVRRGLRLDLPHTMHLLAQHGAGQERVAELLTSRYGYKVVSMSAGGRDRWPRQLVLGGRRPKLDSAPTGRRWVLAYCHSPYDHRATRLTAGSDGFPGEDVTAAEEPALLTMADVVLWDWGGRHSHEAALRSLFSRSKGGRL